MIQHDTTLQRILDAGFELLISDGIRHFTVEELAARLAMSKKTIYKYYGSKEELIYGILHGILNNVQRGFTDIVNSGANPLTKFEMMINLVIRYIQRIKVERINELKLSYPDLWRELEQFRFERRQEYAQVIQEGQDQGLIRSDFDADSIATLFMSMINAFAQPELFVQLKLTPAQIINMYLHIVTRGIYTKEGIDTAKPDKSDEH